MSESQVLLEYAGGNPGAPTRSRVWAGVAVCMAGLGLIVLGGCFLVGVMLVVTQGFATPKLSGSLGPAALALMGVLYLLAGICFLAAAAVFFLGIRGLVRLMHGR